MAEQGEKRTRGDMYGDGKGESKPAVPAATVVLLRGSPKGAEVLMLRKNVKIDFGGMWVFPGGRIDPEDQADDDESTARNAAARETQEEAGIDVSPDDFVWFAHWTPPPTTPVRFATWFFAARAGAEQDISIDGGEIHDHAWIRPQDALDRHAAEEIELVPPTWVTLYHLARYHDVDAILKHFGEIDARVYETHIGKASDGNRVAMWDGDAGYQTNDANAAGPRHRLIMAPGGFHFEHEDDAY